MDLAALAGEGDRNLGEAWATLGRHAGFALGRADSIAMSSAGLPMPYFNGAFAGGPCADPARTVAEVMAFFAARNVPYLLWVREGVDGALRDAGLAAGLRDVGGPPGMLLPSIGSIPAAPAGLDIRLAASLDELNAHRRVVAGGFGMPPEIAHLVLSEGLLADPDVAIAVGYVDGEPVTTALLARSGGTAGVYNVATLTDHRGKGYGEATTWAVIAEGARRGCTHSVLQSSEAGYPVYRRMGFIDVGRYQQLQGPP